MSKDSKDNGFRPSGITKLALLMASMMVLMGSAAVSPSLHGIEVNLGASKFLVSMIISLPSLVVAILGFPMGYVADKVGLAKTLIVSLIVFIVSGVAGFFCTDIYTLLATRVFLGVGIAGISIAATGLMGIYYDGEERMRVMAIQSAFMGFGGVVLEIIGGMMADVAWNVPFLVYLIAVPILLMCLVAVRDIAFTGYHNPTQRFADNSKKHMAVMYTGIFVLMFMMFIVTVNISDIMTRIGESMTVCGIVLAFMGFTQVITSMLYSRAKRIPSYPVMLFIAFLLQAIAVVLFSSENLVVLCTGVGMMGVGLGFGMPTITNNLAMMSPATSQGKTMGIYSCLMNLGTSLSAVVMGPLIASMGYGPAFDIAGVATFVFGLIVLVVGRSLKEVNGPVDI